ncbi:unnamed protein product [Cylicostephanus goldi]|uniref:Uncharacterized protein n=1 Tax=Cylicostephanus goldi TaxID=71465 RepID=A0A3P6QJX5_CYLGO|nr:unnamed protein product [Cylicostephanus goldi]
MQMTRRQRTPTRTNSGTGRTGMPLRIAAVPPLLLFRCYLYSFYARMTLLH